MQENRWQQIEEIFNRAAVLPVAERRAFVERFCRDDAELCREVLPLVESDSRENGFLDEPVFSLGAEILENDSLDLLRQENFADYRLKKLLGRGGMGAVFLAEDTRLERLVAVKILPSSVAEKTESVFRFRQEARAALGVTHQNIAHIYEFSQYDGRYFLAMEYVAGKTLRELIREKLIDQTQAIEIALQIAAALAAAHESGVTHRDIKPENVVVMENGTVKVLDFGLAELTIGNEDSAAGRFNESSPETIPGLILGTTAYMSPEQVRGQTLDFSTDLWSLTIVFYEMLTGKRPFEAATPSDVRAAILRDEPAPLSPKINFSPELFAIIKKGLRKNRLERYRTAAEFIGDVKSTQKKLAEDSIENDTPRRRKISDWLLKAALPLVIAVGAIMAGTNLTGYFRAAFRQNNQTAPKSFVINQPVESLAVLPFENASGDERIDFLSEGLAEDLTRSLGSLNLMRVTSFFSARKMRGENLDEIKKRLNVGAVLRGRIERAGERLFVNVELVNAADGQILWKERLSAANSDLLKLRNSLTSVIVNELAGSMQMEKKLVLPDYGTQSDKAYCAYLEGVYAPDRSTKEGTRRAVESLKKAVETDPNYADAYVALANVYNLLGTWFNEKPDFYQPLAKQTIEKALALNGNSSEAHTTLAKIKMDFERDFPGAEREFQKAIELNPNNELAHHWYGEVYLSAMGRLNESLRELDAARELNPLSGGVLTALACTYIGKKDYEKAIALCDEALVLNPDDAGAYSFKSMALMKLEKFDEALAAANKARELEGGDLAQLGVTCGVGGQTARAREILRKLEADKETSSYDLAIVYAAIGDRDRAFELLEKEAKSKSVELLSMRIDPLLDTLRGDARFAALEKELNFPD